MNNKSILITGGNGFIGENFLTFSKGEVNKKKNSNSFFSKRLNHTIYSPTHKAFDIADLDSVKRYFDAMRPEIVINFAAHRDANSAETQRGDKKGSAWRTNVLGVKHLVDVASQYKTHIIHISTDMVFSGTKKNPGPYAEDTFPEEGLENLSWYGWTKAEGERSILGKKNTTIIRIGNVTKPVYDPKLDYVGKIVYLYDKNKLYPLFNDQFLTLTVIQSLLEVLQRVILRKKSGVFHVGSTDVFTPYLLGQYILQKTERNNTSVRAVSIQEYLKLFPLRYPQYGGFSVNKTEKELQVKFLTWKQYIDTFIANYFIH